MTICNLCKTKLATQKNSHIFPRFLGTSMLITQDGLRKGFKITSFNGLNYKAYQDTPKEDYIFCPDCEFFIASKYETPIANQLYNNRENPRSFFYVYVKDRYLYRVYHMIDYQLFTKFLYSIIFRAAISNNEHFKNFNLPEYFLEKIRNILLEEIPYEKFPLLVLSCPYNPNPTGNFIGAISSNKNSYLIGVNEYIILLDLSNDSNFGHLFQGMSNEKYELVRILTLPYDKWLSLIKDTVFGPVIERMIKSILIKSLIDNLFINKLLKLNAT